MKMLRLEIGKKLKLIYRVTHQVVPKLTIQGWNSS